MERFLEACLKEIYNQQPWLVIGSPPCTMFSNLHNLGRSDRNFEEIEKQYEEAREHLKFCCKVYKLQIESGRYFLHEHPWAAKNWKSPKWKELKRIHLLGS